MLVYIVQAQPEPLDVLDWLQTDAAINSGNKLIVPVQRGNYIRLN